MATVIVCGLILVGCDPPIECLTASPSVDAELLVRICEREYKETNDPRVGVGYARALFRNDELEKAEDLARSLLRTVARADAFHVLGRIAKGKKLIDEARSAYQAALELHLREGRLDQAANDEQGLALLLKDQSRYAEALRMLDRCITHVRASRPSKEAPRIEGYCHLAAAQVLSRLGYAEGARHELDAADPLLEDEFDRASLYVEQANAHQEIGQDARAAVIYEKVLPIAERANRTGMRIRAHINLAYSLAQIGRLEEAARHLDIAKHLDRDERFTGERMHQEARIAFHRMDLHQAGSLLEQAALHLDDGDEEKTEVVVLRARIALMQEDLDTAETWARAGIEQVAQVRQKQSAIELRGWALSSRRAPYEILFVALAKADRGDDALLVFDQWYGRTLLDALARPIETGGQVNLNAAALETDALRELLPSMTDAPLLKGEDPKMVLDAVGSADLLALLTAEGHLWRLTSTGGRVRLRDLGPEEQQTQLLDRFTTSPLDKKLADEAGALLLTDELVRHTPDPLRVVLDGQLSRLPVTALRRSGRPLVSARPIVRTQRLSAARCSTPTSPRSGRALVLGDAQGNLPAARREAERVAGLFGTSALVGKAATSHAFLTTPAVDVLHVATHAVRRHAGGILVLDRPVPALEIFARRLEASTVVLAACGTALASDPEGANSLVTAFLAGGARQVVATLRPVSDPGAEELTRLFYDAGGAGDPVRGLAIAQKQLASTDNRDWPYFAVYGQDNCPPP